MLYTCPSCGAQIVTDATTAATFCYYCHNPVVLAGRLTGSFEPDYVIPFQIDRKKAEEIFGQWIRRKRFVPDSFYSPKQIQTMTGVYFPYWLYRCQLHGNLTAEGRNNRVWTAGNIRYTETKSTTSEGKEIWTLIRLQETPLKRPTENWQTASCLTGWRKKAVFNGISLRLCG